MTICIGALCADGSAAVVASDRMLTNATLATEFEHPNSKIVSLADGCLALTAGNAIAHTELLRDVVAVAGKRKTPDVAIVAEITKQCYSDRRSQQIVDRILLPRGFVGFAAYYAAHKDLKPDVVANIQYQVDYYDYNLHILIAGADDSGAHLYFVENPGACGCFDAIGYHAIGSGYPHAMDALSALGCDPKMSVPEMVFVVYQAKRRAEKALGVGLATDMAVITENVAQHLTDEQIGELRAVYDEMAPVPFDIAPIQSILGTGTRDTGDSDVSPQA